MQQQRRLVGLVAAVAAVAPASGLQLGPEGCVSLFHSVSDTCVIKTNCQGVNTKGFEFALDCWNGPDDNVRHSFGFGGFDPVEEYDTTIACKRCDAVDKDPEKVVAVAEEEADEVKFQKPPTPAGKHPEIGQTVILAAGEAPQEGVVKYGPGKCVSTWKNQNTSRCIMMTKCKNEDMSGYEYGLVCEDEKGNQMQHLFGTGSFEKQETFDTLIVCDKCSSIDAKPTAKLNAKEVQELADDVKELKTTLTNVTKKVAKLKAEVAKGQTAEAADAAAKKKKAEEAAAAAAGATATTTKAPGNLLHHSVNHHKQLRGKALAKTSHKANSHHVHHSKKKPAAKTARRSAKHRKHPTAKPVTDEAGLAED